LNKLKALIERVYDTYEQTWRQFAMTKQLQEEKAREYQPANSPDLNLNDLGVFHSMQSKFRIVRTRAKMKSAARNQPSAPFLGGIGTRAQRARAPAASPAAVPSEPADETPSPTAPPLLPKGCSAFHNNETDADMPCISCSKAGNLPADDGNGLWIRCDANGGWWHEECVRKFHLAAPLPSNVASAWVCAICKVGSTADVARRAIDDEDDGDAAWDSVYDAEVPVRYGLDSSDALWGGVRVAWSALKSGMFEKLARTLRVVYDRVIECNGSNRYDIRRGPERAQPDDDEDD
jgi:hypothetical protein